MTTAVLFSVVLAAVNPEGLQLVGDARFVNGVLRLTPAKNDQHGAAWRDRKVHVRAGFDTTFRFQFTEQGGLGNGADGIAFVIQNNGPRELAAHGGAGGFSSDAQGGRRGGRRAIANSLAVFFDTFQNGEAKDPSDNMVIVNTNATRTKWPPPRLAINSRLPVNLKDGRAHQARIVYRPPLLTVFLDENEVIRTPVDLARMTGTDGMGYVGFHRCHRRRLREPRHPRLDLHQLGREHVPGDLRHLVRALRVHVRSQPLHARRGDRRAARRE